MVLVTSDKKFFFQKIVIETAYNSTESDNCNMSF